MAREWSMLWSPQPFVEGEDRLKAPGRHDGEDQARPWTLRRAVQNGLVIYLVGLLFLVLGVPVIFAGHQDLMGILVRLAYLAVIAVFYAMTAWMCDTPLPVRCAFIVAFIGLLTLGAVFAGWAFLNFGVYVSITLATLMPWRMARILIPGWSLVCIVLGFAGDELSAIAIGLTGVGIGLATGAGIEAGRLSRQLQRSQRRADHLAIGAERERIGRDLHDILGHSLTAISIKAGLAGKLVDRDPDAAKAQIAEVEDIARQALGDVRATASAIRQVTIANEIASARSVLMAAGVDAITPSAVPPMPDERSRLFGYVIREAITNVVRHAHATSCTITVAEDSVRVQDDGVGLPDGPSTGTGLKGLSERIAESGGSMIIERVPAGGTRIVATTPVCGQRPFAGTNVAKERTPARSGDPDVIVGEKGQVE